MSEPHPPQPRRVPIATLLHRPQRPAAPLPPSPELLLAERDAGHAAAVHLLQPQVEALKAALSDAERRHRAELEETRELAARLFAGLETLLAAELAELAHAAAQAVLAAEPALSGATLAALIADAIHGLPRGTLHVPPEALACARPLCPEGWELRPRDGLAPGTVEAEAGPALQQQSLAGRLAALLERAP